MQTFPAFPAYHPGWWRGGARGIGDGPGRAVAADGLRLRKPWIAGRNLGMMAS